MSFKKIVTYLKRVNIYWLVISPIIIAIFVSVMLQNIGEKYFGSEMPNNYLNLSSIIFFLIMSISGFAQILRKEGPGPFGDVSYGFWPIFSGYLIVIITIGAAIYVAVVSF